MHHIYIHIPFCDSKCPYCSFNSFAVFDSKKKSAYMKAILKQLDFEIKRFELKPKSIQSVYFGGGTPSTIDAYLYQPIMRRLCIYLKDKCEITFEANPNSATRNWLEAIKDLGANRLSIGIQSFNEQKLKLLGRIHTANEAKQAVSDAKQVGFDNISIDLIYDTKFDNMEFLLQEAKEAISLDVEHISAYSLTIEDGSTFAKKDHLKVENLSACNSLCNILEASSFEHYEVSNFGKKRSIHNMAYWMGKNYIGIGCGAVGFYKNERYYPSNDLTAYMSNPIGQNIEVITQDELEFEKLFLGLRSKIGVDAGRLSQLQLKKIDILIKEGKATLKKENLVCKNLFLADEIALFLS